MAEEEKADLFGLKLNETGIYFIKKVVRLSSAILIFLLFVTAVISFFAVRGIIQNSSAELPGKWESIRVKAFPYLTLLTSVGNLIAVSYYVKYFKTLDDSISNNNEVLFNNSFRYIFRNAAIFLILLILNSITAIFSLVGLL